MNKTVDFYYVRHGKTLFNELGRMQGYCDSPLTKEGIKMALEAKEELKDIPFDRAYCSTSERCVDTAAIVLEGRDIPIIYTKGLKEMNFGIYEGSRMKNHLQEIDNRRFNTYDWSDVGGENQMMLKQRVQKTYQQIYEEAQDNDKILIVSHGAIFLHMLDFLFSLNIKKYIELIKNDPAEYLPIPNGYAAHFIRSNDKYDIIKLTRRDDSILKILKERK